MTMEDWEMAERNALKASKDRFAVNNRGPADEFEEEALESITKRRALLKESWGFYLMICSMLRDRHKYQAVFCK